MRHELILRRSSDWCAGNRVQRPRDQQKHLVYNVAYLGWQVQETERAAFVSVVGGQYVALSGMGTHHLLWNYVTSIDDLSSDGFQQTSRYRSDILRIFAVDSLRSLDEFQLSNLS